MTIKLVLAGMIIAACASCSVLSSGAIRQAAVSGAARAIQIDCASVLAGSTASTFRDDVNRELERRGSPARATEPDCGNGL